ncbi:MAG TPA: hypothetical protein VMF70_09995 [Gemmatimonadales bacterium]|nr:hypothetical protein [Gemmatimonadales bacterium]
MRRSSWSKRWTSFGTVGLACALALGGCAKKEVPPVAQAGPNHVIVAASDFTFSAPDSVSAGLEMIHLVNNGPSLHHLQVVALDSGKTTADLMNAMKNPGPPPAWIRFVGGPNAVAPGGVDTAIAYLTLAAGNYALMCLIPDSAGIPHFAHGMVRALTVTPSAETPASAPTADMTIHLKDYGFDVTGNLTPGAHTIRVVNDGPQAHEMLIAQMAPRKKAADLVTWVETAKMRGMPPAKPYGGATALGPGASEVITVQLAAGDYGLFCFLPDAKDGKDHVLHGMAKDLKVS